MKGIGDVVSQVQAILRIHSQYVSHMYASERDILRCFASHPGILHGR
jgi:hypothetical protein